MRTGTLDKILTVVHHTTELTIRQPAGEEKYQNYHDKPHIMPYLNLYQNETFFVFFCLKVKYIISIPLVALYYIKNIYIYINILKKTIKSIISSKKENAQFAVGSGCEMRISEYFRIKFNATDFYVRKHRNL